MHPDGQSCSNCVKASAYLGHKPGTTLSASSCRLSQSFATLRAARVHPPPSPFGVAMGENVFPRDGSTFPIIPLETIAYAAPLGRLGAPPAGFSTPLQRFAWAATPCAPVCNIEIGSVIGLRSASRISHLDRGNAHYAGNDLVTIPQIAGDPDFVPPTPPYSFLISLWRAHCTAGRRLFQATPGPLVAAAKGPRVRHLDGQSNSLDACSLLHLRGV